MEEQKKEIPEKILYIDFNQDGSCFCIGAETGFAIFSSQNCEEILCKKGGGIGHIEMLKKTNIIGLVGGGKTPQFSKNKVIIWDESIKNKENKTIMELRFNSNVINLKLKEDKIIVVLETQIFIFDLYTLEILDIINTIENDKGLISISNGLNCMVIAFPCDKIRGIVRVKKYNPVREYNPIEAHDTPVTCLSLNNDGTLLATASEKGTIIRVFNMLKNQKIEELRRGKTPAQIKCIVFNEDSTFLACSSDSDTIHIFKICKDKEYQEKENAKIKFLGVSFGLPSSFAKLKLSNGKGGERIVRFGPNNTIYALESVGIYHMGTFDPINGGESKKNIVTHSLSTKTKLKIC